MGPPHPIVVGTAPSPWWLGAGEGRRWGHFWGGASGREPRIPPCAICGPALLNRAPTCPGGRGKNPTPQNSRVPSPCPWKMLRHPGGGLLAPRGGPRRACQHPWVPAGSPRCGSKGVPQMPPAMGRGDTAPSVPSGLWFLFFFGGGTPPELSPRCHPRARPGPAVTSGHGDVRDVFH